MILWSVSVLLLVEKSNENSAPSFKDASIADPSTVSVIVSLLLAPLRAYTSKLFEPSVAYPCICLLTL